MIAVAHLVQEPEVLPEPLVFEDGGPGHVGGTVDQRNPAGL